MDDGQRIAKQVTMDGSLHRVDNITVNFAWAYLVQRYSQLTFDDQNFKVIS